jgi:hypothetical protein
MRGLVVVLEQLDDVLPGDWQALEKLLSLPPTPAAFSR